MPRSEPSAVSPQLALIEKPGRLGDKQAFALDLVRQAGHDGVTAEEVGAAWHAHKGKHPVDRYCDWCLDTGRSVLQTKALRGLVVRRRISGRWEPRREALLEGDGWQGMVSHLVPDDPFEGL